MSCLPSDSPLRSIARSWVIRLASGQTTPVDLERLHIWIEEKPEHAEAFEDEKRLWQELEAFRSELTSPDMEDAASHDWMPPKDQRHLPHVRKAAFAGFAAAALVLIAAILPDCLLWIQADHLTQRGRIAAYKLADGSQLVLDSDSAIATHFSESERRIDLLRGQIWIRAKHDASRPLRVVALGGSTEDVGTAFAVGRNNGEVQIGVTEGKVMVTGSTGSVHLKISTSQTAHYTANGHAVLGHDTAVENIAPWRNGEIILRHVPLGTALGAVARYRRAPTYQLGNLNEGLSVDAVLRTDQPDDAIASLVRGRPVHIYHLPAGVMVIVAENHRL